MTKDMLLPERELYEQGYTLVCGVAEAGRGPLAGPVCAAAVILPRGLVLDGVDDSKKLTPKKREKLFDRFLTQAAAWGIGWADEQEIDRVNILQATMNAMNRAISQLDPAADVALIDGNRNQGILIPSVCLVGGDGKSQSVAAASILAKVSRDRRMTELDALYPQYGFAIHKGYGTAAHYAALREFGPSPIHRKTFLRKMH